MHIPVNHATLMGDFAADFPRDFEDESEVEQNHHARMADSTSGEGSGEGSPVSSRGNGGCIRDRPVKVIPCPRCQSMNTKFCYYNNYSVNQPRHFCRNCQRYWTVGGTLRNVPVGGGSRKKTRTRSRNDAYLVRSGTPLETPASSGDGLLSANSCMQQLSMLPPTLNGFAPFPTNASQLPFLQFALEQGQNPSLFPQMPPKGSTLSGLQEVPDLQSFYDAHPVPEISPVNSVMSSPMMMSNGFFLPDLHSANHNDALASVMAKAGLWSTPTQQLQALTGAGRTPSATSWDERPSKPNSLTSQQLGHLSGYEERRNPVGSTPQMNATVLPQGLKQAGFWEAALMHSRPLMDDRLVPHVTSSWEEPNSRNFSPNSSTTEEERCPPSNCFGYHEDVVSQPWVGLQASDILF